MNNDRCAYKRVLSQGNVCAINTACVLSNTRKPFLLPFRPTQSPRMFSFCELSKKSPAAFLHVGRTKKDKLSLLPKRFLLYCAVGKLINASFFVIIKMYKQAGKVCLVILFRSEKFEQEIDKPFACGLYAAFVYRRRQLFGSRNHSR